ncbi:DUF2809 domain-containing protein [Granulicella pectinivorans]|nr:DUF2809 domain-containing protein [Granulicella pectinivorans]
MGSMRRRVVCLGWASLTMAAGLAVRMGPLGLPWGVAKYGGSGLWAVMIYWLLCVVCPEWQPVTVGGIASAVAVAVEFGKLYRSPGMDAFRLTTAGKLLLGRYFAWWDILAYLVGIWVVVGLDGWLEGRRSR